FDGDRWLPDAATSAAAAHDREFLRAIASRRFDRPAGATALAVVGRVAEHYARGGPADSVGTLLVALPGADRAVAEAVLGGLARGWPRDRPARLDAASEDAMSRLLATSTPEARGLLVGLAIQWGSQRFEAEAARVAATFLASAQDESTPRAERVDAAGQLIRFRPSDPAAVEALLGLITPRTAPALASGLIAAIAQSQAPEAGPALVAALPTMTPAVRPDALRVLLGRSDWTEALLHGVEQGAIKLSQLSLDQKQALAAHPDGAIAARAKGLLASSGGGLPDPDRQKVIDELSPLVLRTGDAVHGKQVFLQQCAKCHTIDGEGGKVGPDLTGMAAHPKEELLIHILDPSRSVEGNFVQYSVATADGRILSGLLASESRTAVELLDAEGKTHVVLRDEIEELAASTKSVMPEGFEKQVAPGDLADLLEFLTRRGKYLPLDLRAAATVVSTRGMFNDMDAAAERLIFPDWSPKTFAGVPFVLVDPQGDRVPNVVLLYSPNGSIPPKMPRSVNLPCNTPARSIHMLSGVSGWGAQGGRSRPTVSLIVRLHYAGGATEDHPLRNGVEFADYIRPFDVPGSQLAFRLRGQQLRYLAVEPERTDPIERIELLKGPDATAPVVMAVTVEVNQ
ncbi:MAG TPA: c-type cytochrome, partial [Isosphaeraceae bacterium]